MVYIGGTTCISIQRRTLPGRRGNVSRSRGEKVVTTDAVARANTTFLENHLVRRKQAGRSNHG
jgi:hypothetical protein